MATTEINNSFTNIKFNYDLNELYQHIHVGKENAIPVSQLSAKIGYNDRIVHEIIFQARLEGQHICSNNKGYFYPANDQELIEFVNGTTKRAKHLFMSVKKMRETVKAIQDKEN